MSTVPAPLHSERHGRARKLGHRDLTLLVWKRIAALRDSQGLFLGSFQPYQGLEPHQTPARIPDADEFLTARLKVSGLGWSLVHDDSPPVIGPDIDSDLLLDLIELLHNEIVEKPLFVHPPESWDVEAFDKEAGQELYRKHINRVLQLAEPPMELLPSGQLVERDDEHEAHRELYDEPVPDDADPEDRAPIEAAIGQFLRPGASVEDKRSAVKLLADVLERNRAEVKREMLSKDENDLFELANRFAIRHYDRETQKSDYDKAIWLDQAFHVFLATNRAVLRVRARQQDDAASA